MDDKGCSFAVIQNIHSVLGQVFSLAVKDSIILNNPCYDVMDEFKKVNGITPRKRKALTYAEQHAFLEYVKNSRYNCYYWLFVCLFGTGLRLGELAGLTWNDIDFVKEIITVDHALNYDKKDGKTQYYIDKPKTKNGIRTVPMFPEVKEALKELRKENFRNGMISPMVDGYTDFIFLNSWNRLYSKSLIDYQLKKIVKSYNEQEQENAKKENREPLLMPHISAHIFRHTFATRLCESTKDIKVIQDVMGHGDVSTTMNIYASVDEAHKTEVFKGLEEKIKIC
jgi:integrase